MAWLRAQGYSWSDRDETVIDHIVRTAGAGRQRAKAERVEYRIDAVLKKVLPEHGIRLTHPHWRQSVRVYVEPELAITRPHPGIKDVLKRLKADGYNLILVCNAPSEEFVMVSLQQYDLAKFFSHIIISCQVGYRKPHQKFVGALRRIIKPDVSRTIVVGDRLYDDIGLAQALGVPGVLFAKDPHPDNEAYNSLIRPAIRVSSTAALSEGILLTMRKLEKTVF